MGSMIDDELSPRRVQLTAKQATARRIAAEKKLGVSLRMSNYEKRLYERSAPSQNSSKR